MSDILLALSKLSTAEEFFEHLGVPYDPAVLRVNRLHVLKRFNQYLRAARPPLEDMPAGEQRQACRKLLIRAHDDFVHSTAAKERVFKVFQDADGSRRVGLEQLRRTLPSRGGV